MTDTISKAAKSKALEIAIQVCRELKPEAVGDSYLNLGCFDPDDCSERTWEGIALARVLQEHSDKAREVKLQGMHHGWRQGDPTYDILQSLILPDDEPDEVDEISRDLLQRIAHGDSEHREWLKRELSRHLRIVAAGYEIRRKDG